MLYSIIILLEVLFLFIFGNLKKNKNLTKG